MFKKIKMPNNDDYKLLFDQEKDNYKKIDHCFLNRDKEIINNHLDGLTKRISDQLTSVEIIKIRAMFLSCLCIAMIFIMPKLIIMLLALLLYILNFILLANTDLIGVLLPSNVADFSEENNYSATEIVISQCFNLEINILHNKIVVNSYKERLKYAIILLNVIIGCYIINYYCQIL